MGVVLSVLRVNREKGGNDRGRVCTAQLYLTGSVKERGQEGSCAVLLTLCHVV